MEEFALKPNWSLDVFRASDWFAIIIWSRIFPSWLLIARLLYLSESDKFAFERFGIRIKLAHIKVGGQKPWSTIDVNNMLRYWNNSFVPCL